MIFKRLSIAIDEVASTQVKHLYHQNVLNKKEFFAYFDDFIDQ